MPTDRPSDGLGTANPAEISANLRQWAHEAGFDLVGIAPALPGLGIDRLDQWLAQGRHGEMSYMQTGRDARNDPNLVMAGVKSLLVVGLVYRTTEPDETNMKGGRISRYAWGDDYHAAIRERLRAVGERLRASYPPIHSRIAVDSAPVMERDYARLAGLGWIGKNTLLLTRTHGSWLFLGTLLIDVELEYDTGIVSDHCGRCRRCLDACPTQAFIGPYELDARRCISYLTIEHKSMIPAEIRESVGDWIYGCDICQEVCPWNLKTSSKESPALELFEPREGEQRLDLKEILALDKRTFRKRFEGTSLFRIGRNRLVRNAIVVAVNTNDREHETAIAKLLTDDSDIVRETAEWAISNWKRVDCPPAAP
ncbi:tRNA epoxyqueuosine(34) reductase QueG [bacterium]|nr:tRNA epoxyqueuosine(34) reductase QueG [bacterium]